MTKTIGLPKVPSTERTEKWVPVAGFKYYQVSDKGRVRSLDHKTEGTNGVTYSFWGRVLKPSISTEGHIQVRLYKDGEPTTFVVGRVVLENFIGVSGEGLVVGYRNNCSTDCRLSNLYWYTVSEANLYKNVTGTMKKGANHHKAKLNDDKAAMIKTMLPHLKFGGITALAKSLGISSTTIHKIKNETTWKAA